MLILGIETATHALSVCLATPQGLVAQAMLGPGLPGLSRKHGGFIAGAIDTILRDASCTPSDIDGIAVSVGPGLFTGLRVGMATAQILAQTLDVPMVGVTTTQIVAAGVRAFPGFIVPVIDARRGEVFYGVYRGGLSSAMNTHSDTAMGAGLVEGAGAPVGAGANQALASSALALPAVIELTPADKATPAQLDATLRTLHEAEPETPILVVGNGAGLMAWGSSWAEAADSAVGAGHAANAQDSSYPRMSTEARDVTAWDACTYAMPAFEAGQTVSPMAIQAVYLRDADAVLPSTASQIDEELVDRS